MWIDGTAIALMTVATAAQQPAVRSARCVAPEHRFFDYMIGDWRVVETSSGKDLAEDRVQEIHGGCGVRENLRMRGGSSGTATTFYSPFDKLWHTFFHDDVGFYAHLTGLTNTAGRQDLYAEIRFVFEAGRARKARQVTMRDQAGRPRQIGYSLNERT